MLHKLTILLVVISLVGFTACGGGTSPTSQGDPNQNPTAQNGTPSPGTTPDTALVAKPLPSIPMDAGQADKGSSAAGDTGNPVVLGKDAMDFSQCTVDGDALIINPGGIARDNDMGFPAWALYKMGGLSDLRPLSLNVECQPLGLGKAYYIGIADYTSYSWDWFGPVTIPEFQLDLSENPNYFISNLGNLYFLLVCEGDNSAKHFQTTLLTGPARDDLLSAPFNLRASKGEFPDGVELTWEGGINADFFEVWRQDPNCGGPTGEPGGDPGNSGILPAEWYLLGTTTEFDYFDFNGWPGYTFLYKARAVNETGVSEFSNIDEGWSAQSDPPHHEGIFGFAYGDPPDPGGDPFAADRLPGVLIKLVDPGTEELVRAEITNNDGFYQFLDTPSGEYLLSAELTGWVFQQVYTVFVEPGMPPIQFDFYGYPDGNEPPPPPAFDGVYGWVFYDDLNDDQYPGLLPDVEITVKAADTRLIIYSTVTDQDGFFQFLEISPGEYLMTAALEGWWMDPQEHLFEIHNADDPPIERSFYATEDP